MVKLSRIRGSDGTSEAVRATVSSIRIAGSTSIEVDSVVGWQDDFIGTYGKLDTDNSLIPDSIRVFYGHLSGTDIEIDSFFPGYSDDGNSVGDVILLKPTTAWANEIADFLAIGFKENGAFAQADPLEPGFKVVISDDAPGPDPDGNVILWFEPLA